MATTMDRPFAKQLVAKIQEQQQDPNEQEEEEENSVAARPWDTAAPATTHRHHPTDPQRKCPTEYHMGTVQTLQLVVVVVVVGETNTTLQRGDEQLAAHHQDEDQAERETTLHHRSGEFGGGNRVGRGGSLDEAHKNMMNRLPVQRAQRPHWGDVGGMATSGHNQWLHALLVTGGTCCCCYCVDCDTMTMVAQYWVDAT